MKPVGMLRSLGTQDMRRHRPDEEDMVGDLQRGPGDARIDGRSGPAVVGQGADDDDLSPGLGRFQRSEEHTSELQSLMRISYAVFRLKKHTTLTNCTLLNHKLQSN